MCIAEVKGLDGRVVAQGNRFEIVDRLRTKLRNGGHILGGGAGNGLSAKSQELGGIDLLVIYNSGRFRMAGHGSLAGLLAYGNANEIVLSMADEVVNAVRDTPVLAGVNATDPFLNLDRQLDLLVAAGVSGIQNFPTVGLIDGRFRANLEETGMSYRSEVQAIAAASRRDLLTTPYVFSATDAQDMAAAGADIIVCHLGLTAGGSIGAGTTSPLSEAAETLTEWARAARSVNPDTIVLCHGGPLAEPSDVALVMSAAEGIDGFYGASSMERLPVERAIAANVRAFEEAIARSAANTF